MGLKTQLSTCQVLVLCGTNARMYLNKHYAQLLNMLHRHPCAPDPAMALTLAWWFTLSPYIEFPPFGWMLGISIMDPRILAFFAMSAYRSPSGLPLATAGCSRRPLAAALSV